MKSAYCLLVIAASASLSIGCSTVPIATATLPPPAACLMRCEAMSPPPAPRDNMGRLLWELTTVDEYANCAALHDECADLSLQRMKP
jgi:hypothetical protein